MSPAEEKAEVRRWAKARLLAMPAREVLRRSRRILRRLYQLEHFRQARGVLVCVSFRNEPNTWPLLLSPGAKNLFVPRVVAAERRLAVHPFPTALSRSAFGILEPRPGTPELSPEEIDREVDLAVVVGAAFSRSTRHRVGWGKAYFDRFLAAHSGIAAVGLAYDWQVRPALPHEAHDVALDVVVCESQVL